MLWLWKKSGMGLNLFRQVYMNFFFFLFQISQELPHLYNGRRKASKISSHQLRNFINLLKGNLLTEKVLKF